MMINVTAAAAAIQLMENSLLLETFIKKLDARFQVRPSRMVIIHTTYSTATETPHDSSITSGPPPLPLPPLSSGHCPRYRIKLPPVCSRGCQQGQLHASRMTRTTHFSCASPLILPTQPILLLLLLLLPLTLFLVLYCPSFNRRALTPFAILHCSYHDTRRLVIGIHH